jgi:hypothetical protein
MNSLKTKIYLYVLIVAFFYGWATADRITVSVVEGQRNTDMKFKYPAFSLVLFIGYTIALAVEIYQYFKKKQ